MQESPTIRLKPREEKRLLSGHLWVYSNEIDVQKTPFQKMEPGSEVRVESHAGQFLGWGYINPHSLITVRLCSRRVDQPWGPLLLEQRLRMAVSMRDRWSNTPFYRAVFGESDALPGLVIDRYGDHWVVQLNTAGMERQKANLIETLDRLFSPSSIFIRADSSIRQFEQLPLYTEVAKGPVPEFVEIEENGTRFRVALVEGQKTGWFFDQRTNRARMQTYAKDARVLDVCCYLGGFGVQAAVYGAKEVHFIDSSESALASVPEQLALNHFKGTSHCHHGEAFEQLVSLQRDKAQFDLVILDPPAFIKRQKDHAAGLHAYQRLNEQALRVLAPGGVIVSASCSMHLKDSELATALQRAAVRAGKELTILELGQQAWDHPVHPAIPETRYLKAIFALNR